MKREINLLKNIDWLTILIYFILMMLGWVNIYAAVYDNEHQNIFDFSQRYGKQLIWIFASIFLCVIILIIDNKFYFAFSYLIYLFTIILLISVLFFGKEVNGAKSWFEIGSIKFQPAEFTKLATNLAIARFLSSKNFNFNTKKNIFIIAGILIIPAILILFQNDTGSALVYSSFIFVFYREGMSSKVLLILFFLLIVFIFSLIFSKLYILLFLIGTTFFLYSFFKKNNKEFLISFISFVSTTIIFLSVNEYFLLDISHENILLIVSILLSLIFLFISFRLKISNVFIVIIFFFSSLSFSYSVDFVFKEVLSEHHRNRINDVLGIKSDPQGAGYNVKQSKIAIGSGGWNGKGYLQGTQTKYNFVPEQDTDFIFCTVGEEWGFIGTSIVMSLFFIFILRLILLAERQHNKFNRTFGYGIIFIFLFHISINVGMTIGLTPVIGIPLPFFSYGGSSLWSFTILLFIFLRLDISRLTEL